eukprot:COSAG05_NODE_1150_length_5716_cov_69.655866_1_plen_85_part_00
MPYTSIPASSTTGRIPCLCDCHAGIALFNFHKGHQKTAVAAGDADAYQELKPLMQGGATAGDGEWDASTSSDEMEEQHQAGMRR